MPYDVAPDFLDQVAQLRRKLRAAGSPVVRININTPNAVGQHTAILEDAARLFGELLSREDLLIETKTARGGRRRLRVGPWEFASERSLDDTAINLNASFQQALQAAAENGRATPRGAAGSPSLWIWRNGKA